MKRKNLISVVSIVLFTLMTTSLVSAQWGPRPMKRHMKPRIDIERLAEELGLSEEQVTKIKAEQFAARKSQIELGAKVKIAELELRTLLDENAEESDIEAKIKEIGELKTQVQLARMQARLALRKYLTEEQLQQLEELRRERGRRPMRRGRGWREPVPEEQGFEPDFGLEPKELKKRQEI